MKAESPHVLFFPHNDFLRFTERSTWVGVGYGYDK